jgi:TPR repeat protein
MQEKGKEEILARASKRVESKDASAMNNMAMVYGFGFHGVPVDQAKCIDLLRESADLGCPGARYQLGCFHDDGEMGLEQNEEKALKYYREAAEDGHVIAINNLASVEGRNGDPVAAMRHYRLSASGGLRVSMENLIEHFDDGLLHHGDLAETLRAFYVARAEMKSEDRDQYIKHLKMIGEYNAEYDTI